MTDKSALEVTKAERKTQWRIAEVRLCGMGHNNGWRELFTKDIDYKLYMDDGNTMFDTDCYGDHLKSCTIDKVAGWLEKEMQNTNYRRLPILYGLLKGFSPEQWKNLEVVHYGY